ncbi:hypothetical protein SLE2022_005370 [Rubroshorea leprosula]
MGFHFGSIVALLYLGVLGSCHASMPAELHWKSVFSNPKHSNAQKLVTRSFTSWSYSSKEYEAVFHGFFASAEG